MSDPQQIWQEQPEEAKKVSLDEIRKRARKLETGARRKTWMATVIGSLICVAFAWFAARTTATIPRIGLVMLSLWGLYSIWLTYKWIRPRAVAANPTLDHYRAELERQSDNQRNIWRRSGLPWAFVGLALVIEKALVNPRLLKNTIPLFTALAIWFVVFLILKKRKADKLKQEIQDLNNM